MEIGHFYFLKQEYFQDFPDNNLMHNKEKLNNELHDRPCFFAFQDSLNPEISWLVPFSSKTDKYRRIYEKKMEKYSRCDTIVFGDVLGHKKAFLIQNMCPATSKYISCEYIDSASNTSVRISGNLEKELITKSKRVLLLQRQGKGLIFPDVLKIESELIKQLPNEAL